MLYEVITLNCALGPKQIRPYIEAVSQIAPLPVICYPNAGMPDGMGGGNDHASKVVIIAPSTRSDVDVEYLFAQVSVARDQVDVLPNSGNMLAAVGPFAIEQGRITSYNVCYTKLLR